MNAVARIALAVALAAIGTQAVAQATFYEHEGFAGRSFTTQQPLRDLDRLGFNDRASSIVVGSNRWEVCSGVRFRGDCVVLRAGRYPSLSDIGLSDRVSSVRPAGRNTRHGDDRYPPPAAPAPVVSQAVFYEHDGFQGRTFTASGSVLDMQREGFNDRASSVVITGSRWEVCEDARLGGRCVVLPAGRHPSLGAMGLNDRVSSARDLRGTGRGDDGRDVPVPLPTPVSSQVTFYEHEGFEGRSFTSDKPVDDFQRYGFNDRASSAVVLGDRWEVCDDARFNGRCTVLRVGRYPSLAAMGLNDRVSSVRAVGSSVRVDDPRHAPPPLPVYDSRRRHSERVYEARVTSVRAVVGRPEQRCWVEQEPVPAERAKANVPGAIIGAVLGGVLGHQVGGGRGKDVATAGGAVVGAVVGAQVGRNGNSQPATQDVQRCESTPGDARADYFDVTYEFRGQEHRVQMTTPPGPTVQVNEQGEPRT